MNSQMQIYVDQDVYNRLMELQVAPYKNMSEVIGCLLFHSGHKPREVIDLEAEEQHFTLEQEIERSKAGVYDSAVS